MNVFLSSDDLKSNNGMHMQRKDMDMNNMYPSNGSQNNTMPYMPKSGMGNDDLSDSHPDQMPNFGANMQNTPFPNAQVPNQPFIQGNTSLPPSSLNPNTSINPNLQQKLMEKMQQVPPNAMGNPRSPMPPAAGGANPNLNIQVC